MCKAVSIAEVESATKAHMVWKDRLQTAILSGKCDIGSVTARRDDQCVLGQWLHGIQPCACLCDDVSMEEVMQLHAEFHRLAGGILSYVERDNMAAALFLLDGEYRVVSEMLIDALSDWKEEILKSADRDAAARPSVAA